MAQTLENLTRSKSLQIGSSKTEKTIEKENGTSINCPKNIIKIAEPPTKRYAASSTEKGKADLDSLVI